MNVTLADWLKQHGWTPLLRGSMLYSREGGEFVDAQKKLAQGDRRLESSIWVAPPDPAAIDEKGNIVKPFIAVAGYFTDEDEYLCEYTFGPAAKELAEAIAQYRASKD